MKKNIDHQDRANESFYNDNHNLLFENLPELMRPHKAAKVLGISRSTIYDWKYRGQMRNVPNDLFYKINRTLFIRTKVLRRWIVTSQGD